MRRLLLPAEAERLGCGAGLADVVATTWFDGFDWAELAVRRRRRRRRRRRPVPLLEATKTLCAATLLAPCECVHSGATQSAFELSVRSVGADKLRSSFSPLLRIVRRRLVSQSGSLLPPPLFDLPIFAPGLGDYKEVAPVGPSNK